MSKIAETIEKIRQNESQIEKAPEILEFLEQKYAELGEDATEEEETEALKLCLQKIYGNVQNGKYTKPDELSREINRKLQEHLDGHEIRYQVTEYDRDGDRSYRLGFRGKNCQLETSILVENRMHVIQIETVLPISCDPVYSMLVCEEIVKYNYSKRFGALQYDERDGEISYRYSYQVEQGFCEDEFVNALQAVLSLADEVYPVIRNLCVGKIRGKKLEEVLKKIKELFSDLTGTE